MEIFQKAIQAVQRNVSALGVYLLAMVAVNGLAMGVYKLIGPPGESSYSKKTVLVCTIGVYVFLAVASAAAQSVVFSRFAKDIDRPLWRSAGDGESLRLYFPLWIVLNASVYVMNFLAFDLCALLDNEEIGVLPRWLLLFSVATYIPIGAAVMFNRNVTWRNLGEALSPLLRQFAKFLMLCCATGILFVFMLSLAAGASSQPALHLVIDVIFSYFDCVIFCAAWHICIIDRQNPEDSNFDF